MVKRTDGGVFDKLEYYARPELYEAIFYKSVLPHITFLANCMYWDQKYPRLITKAQLRDLRGSGSTKLKFIADISCDVGGSVEFMSHCTTIEHPYYGYDAAADKDTDIMDCNGVGILSVEILPTELPRDSSEFFGDALMPLLLPLLQSQGSASTCDWSDLPAELHRACIASHGVLLPQWEYIARLRAQNQANVPVDKDFENVAVVELRVSEK